MNLNDLGDKEDGLRFVARTERRGEFERNVGARRGRKQTALVDEPAQKVIFFSILAQFSIS